MQHRGQTLTAIEAAELRRLYERMGQRPACQYLRISGETLARAMAQMHLQRGSIELIRQGLREMPIRETRPAWLDDDTEEAAQ